MCLTCAVAASCGEGPTAGAPRPGLTGVRDRTGLTGLSGETPVAGDSDEFRDVASRVGVDVII